MGGAAGGNYQDTISKPSFITQEKNKEKEVFLNGEVNNIQRKQLQQTEGPEKTIKKTQMCLKGLKVEKSLAKEALKNYYN